MGVRVGRMRSLLAAIVIVPVLACGPEQKPDPEAIRTPAYSGPVAPTGSVTLSVEPQQNDFLQVTLHNGVAAQVEYNLECSTFEQRVGDEFTPVGDASCRLYASQLPALQQHTFVYASPVTGGTFRMRTDVTVVAPTGASSETLLSEPFELP